MQSAMNPKSEMKVLILAGGLGTRLSEETCLMPKPMVEIGGRPILWHIMKSYSSFGFNDFIILTGYKSHVIKEYFINYYHRYSDITVDLSQNTVEVHNLRPEPWRVTMLYTGENTMTGGRILRAKEYVGDNPFLLTYGDGVSDVDIPASITFHKKSGAAVTLAAVKPQGRFGALEIKGDDTVKSFIEKPCDGEARINGGFFVCEPSVFNYIKRGDETIFERDSLEQLAKDGKLSAFKHDGFWFPMDSLRDKNMLAEMWKSGNAPWASWLKNGKNSA